MHIGLNLVFLTPGHQGGMETYARELIPELIAAGSQHKFTAFVNRDGAAAEGPWNELIGTTTIPVQASNRFEWVRGEQMLLPPAARRAGVDLVHSLASTAPTWGLFRRVVTIHDLHYRLVPEAHPGLRSLGMRVLVPLAARRSDRIIVPAADTARDVIGMLHRPAAMIDVVPQGVRAPDPSGVTSAAEVRALLVADDRPIVLSVSAKLRHKNLIRLLGALSRFPPGERPLLVLPGYPTDHEQELREHAMRLGLSDDVRLLAWVSASELEGLYAAADCLVFPSLAEGFGLPVLEAMNRGVPVACSGRGALAEVAGGAALLFDPESESAIADSIRSLLSDHALAERLRVAGRRQAERFSWAQTARGTLTAYERAMSSRP